MQVAIVGPIHPYRGGIAYYTALLAQHFRQSHSVCVYSFQQLYPAWLFPGRSQYDPSPPTYPDLDTNYWLIPWWPPSWWRVQRAWAVRQPQVVIIQWWVPFMAPMTVGLARAARNTSARVVMLCHNVLPHERAGLDAWLSRWALSHADRLVVHSTRDQAQAQQLLPAIPSRVVALPSYGALKSQGWTRGQARAYLGMDGPIALFFGLVRPYKGLMDLLEAMANVPVNIHLLVVGEVWGSIEPYQSRVAALNLKQRVSFINRYVTNEEANIYFAAADVVILPYREATGSAVLQLAFGLGVPVIATRAGGMDEAVEDGKTGFLVEPADVRGLAKAITRFFKEERAAEFRQAIAAQAGRFAWATVEAAILSE